MRRIGPFLIYFCQNLKCFISCSWWQVLIYKSYSSVNTPHWCNDQWSFMAVLWSWHIYNAHVLPGRLSIYQQCSLPYFTSTVFHSISTDTAINTTAQDDSVKLQQNPAYESVRVYKWSQQPMSTKKRDMVHVIYSQTHRLKAIMHNERTWYS